MSAIILLDGGMGQELVARSNVPATPLWSTDVMRAQPGLVAAVHGDYFAAGADIATTNTYAIHRDRLVRAGVEDQFEALHDLALTQAETARAAHGGGRIAGAIGPLAASYRPDIHPAHDLAVPLYREVAAILAPRCDLLICETVASLAHASAVLEGALGHGVPVWLAFVDKDERYRLINRQAANWLGMKAEAVVGRTVREILGEAQYEDVRELMASALRGQVVAREGLSHFGGKPRWVSGFYVPHRDETGAVTGFVALLSDVSDRKQTEDQLKESEERLRMVADNVPGMLTRADAQRRFTFINREAERWLGLPEEEVIGRHVWEVIGESSYQSFKPYIDRVLSGEQVSFETERNYIHGESRWTAGTLTPDYDSEGRVRGYYAMLLDVSARRRAQESARRAQQQLIEQQRNEQESVERELTRVRDQLISKTRLAAVGEVAASVAHDLRNPLGAIRNAKFYLSRKLPQSEGKWREYLEVMEREIVTADRIIHDLMDMTRARDPEFSEVELEKATREAFSRLDDRGGVNLEIRLERDPFLIFADPDQIARVIYNLLLNAVQAMNGDGRIVVSADSDADFDSIRISDTGPGVAADLRGRLFEPLITDKAKGTGLGLAICRQIVERHGGRITLEQSHDGGSEFLIKLPRLSRRGRSATPDEAESVRLRTG